jgi:hypothetical protein
MSWYDKIKGVDAEEGFVYIRLGKNQQDVVLPVGEAIDRAVAIKQMVAEEHYRDLAEAMMSAAWEAQQQIQAMKESDRMSFDYLKEHQLRMLIGYGKHDRRR